MTEDLIQWIMDQGVAVALLAFVMLRLETKMNKMISLLESINRNGG